MNRILIYEPNPELLSTYRGLLENQKFWVFACSDETEARKLISSQIFHLCIWSGESHDALEKLSVKNDHLGLDSIEIVCYEK